MFIDVDSLILSFAPLGAKCNSSEHRTPNGVPAPQRLVAINMSLCSLMTPNFSGLRKSLASASLFFRPRSRD